ncbi:unnamed protein product [Victoria cruziana]
MASSLSVSKSLSLLHSNRSPVAHCPLRFRPAPFRVSSSKNPMVPESVRLPEGYDRKKELKDFDDSKIGVKGLVDGGVGEIPPFFVHPTADLPPPPLPSLGSDLELPVIDLSGASDPERRPAIVAQVAEASRTWGFFQAINHGIPDAVLDSTIGAVRRFNELPVEEKAPYYTRVPGSGVSFATNFDLFVTKAASWRDTLQIRMGPVPVAPEEIPPACREEIVRWGEWSDRLGRELMAMLCEGMGVGSRRLEEISCMDGKQLVAHYYPWCPQPDLTWGLTGHADPGVLTVLLQDQVGGLQVKHRDRWVDAKPITGAVVINIGDLLQMISNGLYKSVEHRVVANRCREARVAIAIFYNPGARDDSAYFGPLPELLSPETPPLYRQFTMQEYLTRFFNKGLDGRSLLDVFRI